MTAKIVALTDRDRQSVGCPSIALAGTAASVRDFLGVGKRLATSFGARASSEFDSHHPDQINAGVA